MPTRRDGSANYAASAFGMKVVWYNRYRLRPERLPGAPDREI